MKTIAILQLVTALILLGEVQARLFSANNPRELYWNLCHPLFLKMPMHISTALTFFEVVIAMLLMFNGYLMARGIV